MNACVSIPFRLVRKANTFTIRCRRSRRNHQALDLIVGDGEVPSQVSGASWEVAGEAAGRDAAVRVARLDVQDFGGVDVLRRWTELPRADLLGPAGCRALVDDDGVVCEQGNDALPVALSVEPEVA